MPSASPLRQLLADTALRLGPESPTLCAPWDVRDLVAHLVVRESRPDALPGIGLPVGVLTRHTEAVQSSVAREVDFTTLVERFRQGPPSWWPTRVATLEALANTAEFAIHHEDMARAQGHWSPGDPSPIVLAQPALWQTLRTVGRVLYRSAGVGVVAVSDDQPHPRVVLRRPRPGRGTVILRGTPLELVLHAFGRTSVAHVVMEGTDPDVAALTGHTRAI